MAKCTLKKLNKLKSFNFYLLWIKHDEICNMENTIIYSEKKSMQAYEALEKVNK